MIQPLASPTAAGTRGVGGWGTKSAGLGRLAFRLPPEKRNAELKALEKLEGSTFDDGSDKDDDRDLQVMRRSVFSTNEV
jgi:hypothetical protein